MDDQIIFIHNPRASGTSISRALLHGEDPKLRNSIRNSMVRKSWGGSLHMTGPMIRAEVSREIWDNRFKFAVVRNPWDRLVSLNAIFRSPAVKQKYASHPTPKHIEKLIRNVSPPNGENMSWGQKIDEIIRAQKLPLWEWIQWCHKYRWSPGFLDDKDLPLVAVPQVTWFAGLDKVFKFENRTEINDFLAKRDYSCPARENARSHKPWRRYYNNQSFEWVGKTFKKDIDAFDYGGEVF